MRALLWVALAAACRGETKPAATPPLPAAPGGATVVDGGLHDDLAGIFAGMTGGGSGSPADAIAKLRALRDAASPKDAALFDQGLAALTEMQAALADPAHEHVHLVAGLRLYLAWMRALADHEGDDVATSRLLVSSIAVTAVQIENMDLDREIPIAPIKQDALARARALTKRFPSDARTWRLLAWAIGEGTIEAMRAYATCARLDPKQDCGDKLAAMRADYVLPYCEGSDIRRELAWREGLDHDAPGAVAVADPTWNGSGSLHVLPAARFTAADVRIVETRMGSDHQPHVTLWLRHELADAYSAWIDELQKRESFAVIEVGTTLLVHTHHDFYAIPVHESATWLPRAKIEDVCTTTRTRALPSDL